MPHLVLSGTTDLEMVVTKFEKQVQRWGAAVLKTEALWLRSDRLALLIEGVVVEHSRPLHAVAVVSAHHGDTSVRLWPVVEVERTPAVQRWLVSIAAELRKLGGGPLKTTNITADLVRDLGLD
jgi:hypothetical protein